MHLRSNKLQFFFSRIQPRNFHQPFCLGLHQRFEFQKDLSTGVGDYLAFLPWYILFIRTTNFCAFFRRGRSPGKIWQGLLDRGYLSSLFGDHSFLIHKKVLLRRVEYSEYTLSIFEKFNKDIFKSNL